MADPFEGVDLTSEQQQELATLRKGYFLLDRVVKDPKHGTPLKRALREIDPSLNVQIPEDIAEPLLAPLREKVSALETDHSKVLAEIDEKKSAIDKVIESFQQERKDERDVSDLTRKIDAAARHYRFTDEGKQALVEHMKATGTPDPMTAGAFLVQNMEKPEPAVSSGLAPMQARQNGAPDVDLFQLATGHDDESLKLLHSRNPKDQEKWMMAEVNRVLAEGAEAA